MRGPVVISLLAALLLAGCGGSGSLTAKQLQKEQEAVHSTAAEGALLAGQVAENATTEPFARVHSATLVEQAKSSASSLEQATASPQLELARRRTARRATEVQAALEELHQSPDDAAVGRRVQRELERLAR
jgi:hypothetical protein